MPPGKLADIGKLFGSFFRLTGCFIFSHQGLQLLDKPLSLPVQLFPGVQIVVRGGKNVPGVAAGKIPDEVHASQFILEPDLFDLLLQPFHTECLLLVMLKSVQARIL